MRRHGYMSSEFFGRVVFVKDRWLWLRLKLLAVADLRQIRRARPRSTKADPLALALATMISALVARSVRESGYECAADVIIGQLTNSARRSAWRATS